jgi:excisionase family DNA binding protein
MENDKLLSVKETAKILGVNHQRVQALISSGRLPSQKIGNSHVIKESDLALVADRKVGRPSKPKAD